MNKNRILIYDDYGVGDTKILGRAMGDYFIPRGIEIHTTNARDIIHRWALNDNVAALVMPGGRAIGYQARLHPHGNKKITDWVMNGGVYFGICAGAYYAAERIIFEPDIPELAVQQNGGLGLVSADAIGTLHRELNIAPYRADTASMAAPQIEWVADGRLHLSYYHGGPYFQPRGNNMEILAQYVLDDGDRPAIVAQRVGHGRVIASGVHVEVSGPSLAATFAHPMAIDPHARHVARTLQQYETYRKSLFDKVMNEIILER
ncbi:MAG: hypothetical protein K2L94_04000 [Alphaproteobacteria bacterium]|nr:hypothetical protein [Alphaproteobacteria bacterium]